MNLSKDLSREWLRACLLIITWAWLLSFDAKFAWHQSSLKALPRHARLRKITLIPVSYTSYGFSQVSSAFEGWASPRHARLRKITLKTLFPATSWKDDRAKSPAHAPIQEVVPRSVRNFATASCGITRDLLTRQNSTTARGRICAKSR